MPEKYDIGFTINIHMYQKRTYRKLARKDNLVHFKIVVKETDLFIQTLTSLPDVTKELVMRYRGYVESYISYFPEFARTLIPWESNKPAHRIIVDMIEAGKKAGVGPMAAIAGAISEYTGKGLLEHSDEVIVENGGDLFIKTNTPLISGIFAGESTLSMRIGICIDSTEKPISVCTSSGTIGHSLSHGKADAVCVISDSGCIADAAATSIGNHVKSSIDIQSAIDFGKQIDCVNGIVIIIEDKIGMWGDVDIVPIKEKRVEFQTETK